MLMNLYWRYNFDYDVNKPFFLISYNFRHITENDPPQEKNSLKMRKRYQNWLF
jgi:hypothetical protein